ncbi:MAG: FtsX-like permease family protein [Pseudomonadota bacterium]
MLNTRWIKLLRDLQMTPWRIALMLLAIAIGIFGFTTMFTGYVLVTREVSRNYLATNPASATLQVENIDTDLLAGVRRFPGIALAQAGTTLNADLYYPDGTIHPLRIFVAEDFYQLKINTIFPDAGAWPPSPNSLLLERSSLTQANINIGDSIKIRLDNGDEHLITASGTAHDSSMPVPSMVAFGYASPDTIISLGINSPLTDLKITMSDKNLDADGIEKIASQLALWIQQQGHKVSRVRIPPPGEHPHQRIIFSVTGVLLLFSGIALILGAVITATIIDGLMAQQVRQIGVMKTLGGSAAQIASLYLTFVLMLSVLATSLSVPAGLAAGSALCKMVLNNLNFDIQNLGLSHWVYFTLISAGILPPLFMAAVPIIKATRSSVQNTLLNIGTSRHYYVEKKIKSLYLISWLHRIPGMDRTLIMAIRNSFRRKGRLILILALLSSAGAMFITSLNLKHASQQYLIDAAAERHYDLEISLSSAEDRQKIAAIIESVKGVDLVEAWSSSTVARHRPDGINIEKTYSDGGHGALYLTVIPKGSQLLSIKMQRGHWLGDVENSNDASVVLNRKALEYFPDKSIGDQIVLGVAGSASTLRIVGIAEQKMTSGMAYVSTATYQKMTGQGEHYKNYRMVLNQHDEKFLEDATKNIAVALSQQNIKINNTLTEHKLRHEIDGHFTVLVNALLFISILMAIVGVFGLGVVMSTHIAERTREFGIMRSIGASTKIIMRNVIIEALFISVISWVLAIALSLLLSTLTSTFLGKLIFDQAFPLTLSLTAPWIWLLILTIGAILASAYPAKKAVGITIKESFSY